jgi:lysophospholipase L1-like esterase
MSCSLEEPRQGAAASTIRPRASRLRRALQPLAAFVLGTTVLLVLLELGLRVTGAFAPPPDLPGMARLAELEEATSRVLCVGDSYTYGIGASEGMDYPRQLEAALNGRLGPEERVAVVNAGIAGANSSMMLEALPGFLAAVEPDLVVLLAGTANATNCYGFQGGRPSEGPRARLERALFDVRVYRLWHLVRNHMGLGRARTLAAVPTGVDGAVAGYLLWARERTRLGGGLGSLSPGFLEGAELLRLGRFDRAAELFRVELEREPERSDLLWGLGMASWGQRRKHEARAWFQQAIRTEPSDPNPYCALAELYVDWERIPGPREGAWRPIEEARDELQRCLEVEPGSSCCAWMLAMVERSLGDDAAGLAALDRCLEVAPSDARCAAYLTEWMRQPTWREPALAILSRAARVSPVAQETLEVLQLEDQDRAIRAWLLRDLNAIVDLAQAHGARVIVQNYPQGNTPYSALPRVATQRGLPFLDHREAFRLAARQGRDLLIQDGHCNDEGYGLMAERLAEAIVEQGLLAR